MIVALVKIIDTDSIDKLEDIQERVIPLVEDYENTNELQDAYKCSISYLRLKDIKKYHAHNITSPTLERIREKVIKALSKDGENS